MFVGLFELGASKKYNAFVTESTSTEDGPVAVGGFLFKYRDIGGYRKPSSAGQASCGRSVCLGRLVSCLRAAARTGCMSVLVARQKRQEKKNTRRETFFRSQAQSFAANENAECDDVTLCLTAKGFASHPSKTGHPGATTL